MSQKNSPKNDPWIFAVEAGRDYLIMEDISAAIDSGSHGDRDFIQKIVLKAISERRCEDVDGCAWIAINHKKV